VVGLKPKNSIVIYAAEAGSKALDGLFTPILANSLQLKGRTINQIMISVRSEVYAKSSGQQTPGEYNQLFEELILGEAEDGDLSAEKIFAATPAPTSYVAPKPPRADEAPFDPDAYLDNMVLVQGGELPAESELAGKSVKSFYIGCTEVTWLEWKKVRNWAADHGYDIGNLGAGSGNDYPVLKVNWYDSLKWCNAKSEMTNLTPVYRTKGEVYRSGEFGEKGAHTVTQDLAANGYRLPTEAEWEWAAIGGSKSMVEIYSNNFKPLSKEDGYYDKTERSPSNVGKRSENELGLFDMTGNAWEWCWDGSGSNRCIRGGGWSYYSNINCPPSYRLFLYPIYRYANFGLRLARSSGN
jgi:formylglycine-generating enzyme required for sulfatase activity